MFINFIFLSGLVLSKMVYCSWNETGHSLSSDDEMAMKEKNQLIDHLIENKDYTSSESESNEIKKGIEYFDEAKDTPPEHKNIWEAIEDQDIKAVDYFIRIEQFDPNLKDKKDNSTLLHWAAYCGNVEIVKYLVSKGADINARTDHSILPLHGACWNAKSDIVKYFISELKMDPNLKGYYNETCLHYAVASRNDSLEIVKYLVSKGADINARDNDSFLPLHIACKSGNLEIVKYFISELKMDPNSKGYDNETCLLNAVYVNNLELVKYLVSKGADINARNKSLDLPLYKACKNGNLEIVKYFISGLKMDPNSKGYDNETCLHWASSYGTLEMVKYLVSKGADINARDNDSDLPLHIACKNGNLEIVKYFISELKMDPNSKGKYNFTCLHYAVYYNNLELVKFLIENGAKESLHEKNNNQRTPLELAEYWNENEELIEYLKSQMN